MFLFDWIFVFPGIAGMLMPGHLWTKVSCKALNSRKRRSSTKSESPMPLIHITPVTVYSICVPPIPVPFYLGFFTVNLNILGSVSTLAFTACACFSGTFIFLTFSNTSVSVWSLWRRKASSATERVLSGTSSYSAFSVFSGFIYVYAFD